MAAVVAQPSVPQHPSPSTPPAQQPARPLPTARQSILLPESDFMDPTNYVPSEEKTYDVIYSAQSGEWQVCQPPTPAPAPPVPCRPLLYPTSSLQPGVCLCGPIHPPETHWTCPAPL